MLFYISVIHNILLYILNEIFIFLYYRYSGEYNNTIAGHAIHTKSAQNNNGYIPFANYSLDYSPPPLSLHQQQQQQHLSHPHPQQQQYHHTLNLRSNTAHHPTVHMNGQISSGNLTLTRNRNDLRQDNGLPNIQQGSLNSLQNGLLGNYKIII